MTDDTDHEGESELARQARAVKEISSAILMVLGGIAAIAAIIVFIQSGKFNLILSATSALMLIVGIIVLFTLKKRRPALIGAAVVVAILIFAAGAVFFARPSESGSFATPFSGQRVNGESLFVAGNVEGVSSTLLCIVKVDSGNYFPHPTQSANGQWSANVGIGPQTINDPLPLTLFLATATQAVVEEIRIREQADPEYNNHGLGQNLPPGIGTLTEVKIVRTS